jgi:hypothetical protein
MQYMATVAAAVHYMQCKAAVAVHYMQYCGTAAVHSLADTWDVQLLFDDVTQLGIQHCKCLAHCILLQELLEPWWGITKAAGSREQQQQQQQQHGTL